MKESLECMLRKRKEATNAKPPMQEVGAFLPKPLPYKNHHRGPASTGPTATPIRLQVGDVRALQERL